MSRWQLRGVVPEDLEDLVRLDDASSTTHELPVFPLADVVSATTSRHPAVLAIGEGRVVGAAVSHVYDDQAWIVRLALHPEWRGQGLGTSLLSDLEQRLVSMGIRRLRALLPSDETGTSAFLNNGFVHRPGLSLFEKSESIDPESARTLHDLGGVVPPSGLWDAVAGMTQVKTMIERRLVLPLARPEQAQAHGVEPPRAVVLFGPPGTGKTTFARAIASRLAWPFLELFPSRLVGTEGGLAAGINEVFTQIAQLDHVVVFIDEVEEIAAAREHPGTSVAVVNELLKALVSFREGSGRLLICATNSLRLLDSAFLRHGRFDYVIPVGPPDETARAAMWATHLTAATTTAPLETIVRASANFTPADIAHAARAVAQATFECSVDTGTRCQASEQDYLDVIARMRPTVTPAMTTHFHEDIESLSRV